MAKESFITHACPQLTFSILIQFSIPCLGNCVAHSGQSPFLSSGNQTPTDQPDLGSPIQRLSSQVILDCIMLIVKTNYHRD